MANPSVARADEIRFDGQVAIVTGAGKGLGRAYALRLAERGAAIVVNNRRHEGEAVGSADRVVEEICASGGRAAANDESVETPGSGRRIIEFALETFGRIDVVIPNAGVSKVGAFHRMSLEEVDEILAVNLGGAVELVHAAMPHFRAQRGGSILLTSSSAALYGDAGFVAYATAKAALMGLVAALGQEASRVGVTVNAIVPFAHTPMTEALFAGDSFPDESAAALGPDSVASLVVWLVSRECGRTGETWVVGGRVVQRAAVVLSPGMLVDDVFTPELLAARSDEIADLEGAVGHPTGQAMLDDIARRTLGLD